LLGSCLDDIPKPRELWLGLREITEALALFAEKNAENAYLVKARKRIHDANVAGNRLIGADGTAIVFHHAQLGVALSRSLAIPHNLEQGEVCGVQEKTSDDEKRENPFASRPFRPA
jgi:hypothetical protein